MQTLPSIKRGDSFELRASLVDDSGLALVGVAESLKSEIRNSREQLIDTLLISETETPGDYAIKANDTSKWPVDDYLYMDIQYTNSGTTVSSETLRIIIEKDVTR